MNNHYRNLRIRISCLQSFFVILGNTFGIWFTYLVVRYFFIDIVSDLNLPELMHFVEDGTILVITFSILTTVIMNTSKKYKFNLYNITALVIAFFSVVIYAKIIGMNGRSVSLYAGLVPFLISIPLLFFSFYKSRILNRGDWNRIPRSRMYNYDIFLAFAIAGNKNQTQREEIEGYVNELDKLFKSLGYKNIFNASKYFDTKHNKQEPADAATEDFMGVENSQNFVLFYPEKVPSSALMELGYALKDRRNILIISKSIHELPFLARGMAEAHQNVTTIYYDEFDELVEKITFNHTNYLVK